MARYILKQWERNGYNDSDWYGLFYDEETDTVTMEETGTTRFANALHYDNVCEAQQPTEAILDKAMAAHARTLEITVAESDRREVDLPTTKSIHKGVEVAFMKDLTFRPRGKPAVSVKVNETGCIFWDNGSQISVNRRSSLGHAMFGTRYGVRIGVELPDGRRLFTSLENVKLARPYKTDVEIQRLAQENARLERASWSGARARFSYV